jgi:hypothetical protein
MPIRIDFTAIAQSSLNFLDYIRVIEEQHKERGWPIDAIVFPLNGATMFGYPIFGSDFEYQKWKEEKEQEERNAQRPLPYN